MPLFHAVHGLIWTPYPLVNRLWFALKLLYRRLRMRILSTSRPRNVNSVDSMVIRANLTEQAVEQQSGWFGPVSFTWLPWCFFISPITCFYPADSCRPVYEMEPKVFEFNDCERRKGKGLRKFRLREIGFVIWAGTFLIQSSGQWI